MTPDNAKLIWKLIQEAGDSLKDKLPSHPNHPKGRNPYAHVALEIKTHFQMTYKDIPDDRIDALIKYLEYIKENPS